MAFGGQFNVEVSEEDKGAGLGGAGGGGGRRQLRELQGERSGEEEDFSHRPGLGCLVTHASS
jgi:hypothetical protein